MAVKKQKSELLDSDIMTTHVVLEVYLQGNKRVLSWVLFNEKSGPEVIPYTADFLVVNPSHEVKATDTGYVFSNFYPELAHPASVGVDLQKITLQKSYGISRGRVNELLTANKAAQTTI